MNRRIQRSTPLIRAGLGLATAALGSGVLATTAATAAPQRADNTFASAYHFKTAHKVGKRWTVEVVKVIKNANAACKKADPMFYSNPKKGYQYVVVDFKMKNLTGPKKDMNQDITFALVTSGLKHQYGEVYGIVAPNDESSKPQVAKGKSQTGAFTFEVRKSDVNKVRVAAQDDQVLAVQYFKL